MKISFSNSDNWNEVDDIPKDIIWTRSIKNGCIPYVSKNYINQYSIKVNDFPDEPLYTLISYKNEKIHFDDWPPFWDRPE